MPELALEEKARAVRLGARTTRLTLREWPLMVYLVENRGRPVSREELIEKAWRAEGRVTENNVDVYIGYLRRKLAELGGEVRIETVRGEGFILTLQG